jgi:hypothetical protein
VARRVQRMTDSGVGSPEATPRVKAGPSSRGSGPVVSVERRADPDDEPPLPFESSLQAPTTALAARAARNWRREST